MPRNIRDSRRRFIQRAWAALHTNTPEELLFTRAEMRKALLRRGHIYRSNGKVGFTTTARVRYWTKNGFPLHWNDLSISRRMNVVRTIVAVQMEEVLRTLKGWSRRHMADMIPEVQKRLSMRMGELEKQVIEDEVEMNRTPSASWADTLQKRNERRTNFISILEGASEYLRNGPIDWK